MVRTIFLDLETAPRPGIEPLLPEPDAPSNYKDATKIEAYKAEQRQQLVERAAMDVDLCRVVAIGVAINDDPPIADIVVEDEDEVAQLQFFGDALRHATRIIGFNIAGFDLRILTRRAQLLGVPFPSLELGRFRYDKRIIDLQHVLSFGDGPQKGKSLDFYARLFGITEGTEDEHTGADIGRLVAAFRWDAVAQHVRCDVEKTRALARRLGVVPRPLAVSV